MALSFTVFDFISLNKLILITIVGRIAGHVTRLQ
jgi:hypothetical protein